MYTRKERSMVYSVCVPVHTCSRVSACLHVYVWAHECVSLLPVLLTDRCYGTYTWGSSYAAYLVTSQSQFFILTEMALATRVRLSGRGKRSEQKHQNSSLTGIPSTLTGQQGSRQHLALMQPEAGKRLST